MENVRSFLILVTGHAAAGKTTIAPKLADELGAIWISRVYSEWKPAHPALTSDNYDPKDRYQHLLRGRCRVGRLLVDVGYRDASPAGGGGHALHHPWNREMFYEQSASWRFPMVEVALHGEPEVLLNRARERAGQPGVHEIKARFSVRPEKYAHPYEPVLDDS